MRRTATRHPARRINGPILAPALFRSEDQYRLVCDSIPLAGWIWDLETYRILAVNDAATRLYGYSRREFLTLTLDGLRPPEEVPRFPACVDAQVVAERNGGFSGSGAWTHRAKSGRPPMVDVQWTACSSPGGARSWRCWQT